ncbi:MAG: DinB family protein [Gemmatimonadales bacterium]|nr:DinB family protein [Gemmatimonadales bacterium]MDZ4390277.1 DinB family protein [Gemmatimonadales bacterium]
MSASETEPWLRGPIEGIPALLLPAAHAFQMAWEDVERAVAGLTDQQVWHSVEGIPPLGFHLAHLSGSTDRLLSYARGEALTPAQREVLLSERTLMDTRPALSVILERWRATVQVAQVQLAATDEATLLEPRLVGRRELPSTVLGLIFHAAEHAARHTGQVVTTAAVVRGVAPGSAVLPD